MTVLSRRTKNNPVLIGKPGVGKTAIAEGPVSMAAAAVKAAGDNYTRKKTKFGDNFYEIPNDDFDDVFDDLPKPKNSIFDIAFSNKDDIVSR